MFDWMQIVAAAAPSGQRPSEPWGQFLWLIVFVGLAFYFIIIRPQRREQQQKEQMVQQIEKGDRVVTIGGIHGVVSGVDQNRNTVSVDVGKKTNIEFSRNAISTVEKKGKKSAESTEKK
jgi:preprotein translocase subunit YajC